MNCWHCKTELIWGGDHSLDGDDYPLRSGEYSMITNAIKKGIVDSEAAIESLMSFKRSGASAIVTYFALDIAKKISN